jgi:hypothetical protein
MNASKIRVGLAVVALGMAITTGTAVAECPYSECSPPRETDRLPNSDAEPSGEDRELPFTDDLPADEERELPFTDEPDAATPTSGSLPFTGGDVAGMVVIGAAAVGIGAVMVRRSRTRTAE